MAKLKANRARRTHIYNQLYGVFLEYFPEHASSPGKLNVTGLAVDLGMSHETIYRCLRYDDIKMNVAIDMMDFSRKRYPEMPLYWDVLLPYVLPEYEFYRDPALRLKDDK